MGKIAKTTNEKKYTLFSKKFSKKEIESIKDEYNEYTCEQYYNEGINAFKKGYLGTAYNFFKVVIFKAEIIRILCEPNESCNKKIECSAYEHLEKISFQTKEYENEKVYKERLQFFQNLKKQNVLDF